jgi:hypothetical protein
MRADVYDYSEIFFINPDQPIYLRTAENDIVSLYSNISSIPGTASRLIDPVRDAYQTTYHQEIISNIAVVGGDRWRVMDRVKRVRFTVRHVDHLLRHRGKIKALGRSRTPANKHFNLFRQPSNGMTLVGGYGTTYGMELAWPKTIWPIFEIDFTVPLDIYEYLQHVSNYVSFWSFCLGVRLKPRDIHIDRLSFSEVNDAMKSKTYLGAHHVHYVWKEESFEPLDVAGFGSPVRAHDDNSLASLRSCLVAWMDRVPQWHTSYKLMMESFALRRTISAERLINGCRWLEAIPVARSEHSLPDIDVQAIARAASDKALERGYDQAIRARIENAVKWIRRETSEMRFTRLTTLIKDRFGKSILPPNAVEHLTRAVRFRGQVAHGHFDSHDDAEYRSFYKSMRAVEAVCLLLTAHELPISEEGIGQLTSHPMVQGYVHAYE